MRPQKVLEVDERNLIKTKEGIKSMRIDESLLQSFKNSNVSYSEGENFQRKVNQCLNFTLRFLSGLNVEPTNILNSGAFSKLLLALRSPQNMLHGYLNPT